jgi:CheY-like chemotaxis protein
MQIPVIVLGESASTADIQEAYSSGASSFITKPFTNTDTVRKISVFLEYWLDVVELPQVSSGR